mmetsp:Transcript_105314/g.298094  ORF Transcript_105314/g.298094 Transcript_105314/m.298094 type:complete len:227 (+) Transcript_105314:536-1216(+)
MSLYRWRVWILIAGYPSITARRRASTVLPSPFAPTKHTLLPRATHCIASETTSSSVGVSTSGGGTPSDGRLVPALTGTRTNAVSPSTAAPTMAGANTIVVFHPTRSFSVALREYALCDSSPPCRSSAFSVSSQARRVSLGSSVCGYARCSRRPTCSSGKLLSAAQADARAPSGTGHGRGPGAPLPTWASCAIASENVTSASMSPGLTPGKPDLSPARCPAREGGPT